MRLIAVICAFLWLSPAHADNTLPLTIYSKTGEHRFNVEPVSTPAQRAKGMQQRVSLSEDAGMLFLFPTAVTTTFWMKDTLIALDMLFIDENYTIVHIEHNALPHTLEPRSAGQPYIAVVEIRGGTAEKLGISRADKTRFLLPQGLEVK